MLCRKKTDAVQANARDISLYGRPAAACRAGAGRKDAPLRGR